MSMAPPKQTAAAANRLYEDQGNICVIVISPISRLIRCPIGKKPGDLK